MRIVIFGLTVSSSWGNGHADAVARADAGRWLERGHRGRRSSSATCRITPRNRDLTQLPGRRARAVSATGRRRCRDARGSSRTPMSAMVTSYCPDGVAATELVLECRAAAARVLRPRHAGHARSARGAASRSATSARAGCADFDLVLSYTGGARAGRAADAAGRPAGGAALRPRRSRRAPAGAPVAAVTGPTSPISGPMRPTARRRSSALFVEPARRRPNRAVRDRRRAVPGRISLDAEHLFRPPPAAAGASRPSSPRRG